MLSRVYNRLPMSAAEIADAYLDEYAPRIAPMIADTVGVPARPARRRAPRALGGRPGDVPRPRPWDVPLRDVVQPRRRRRVHRVGHRAARHRPGHRNRQGLRHPGWRGAVPDRAHRRRRRPARRARPRVRHQHGPPPALRVVRRADGPPGRAAQLALGHRAHEARRARRARVGQGLRRLRGRRPALRLPAVPPVGAARGHPGLRGARGVARGPHGLHVVRRPAPRRQATTWRSSPSAPACRSTSSASVRAASSSSPCRDAHACVVGAGAREHALAHALSRTADVVGRAGLRGHARAEDHPDWRGRARRRRRPLRRRPRAAPRRRARRPAARPRQARRRPGPRRRAPRGVEVLHEGRAPRRGGTDRALRHLRASSTRPSRSSTSSAAPSS